MENDETVDRLLWEEEGRGRVRRRLLQIVKVAGLSKKMSSLEVPRVIRLF